MSESGARMRWDAENTGQIRSEALEVLSDAFSWRLADERWRQIARILATMADATESGDVAGLAATTARLELAGPLRIIPIDAAEPPPPVRDLLNRLVHALDGVTADVRRQEPPGPGAPDADPAGG